MILNILFNILSDSRKSTMALRRQLFAMAEQNWLFSNRCVLKLKSSDSFWGNEFTNARVQTIKKIHGMDGYFSLRIYWLTFTEMRTIKQQNYQ